MRFLAALLALTLPAFAQIRYSPTGFTAPFISTVTNQASAQTYLGISGGGTNSPTLNGTNVWTGTNTFNTNTILGTNRVGDFLGKGARTRVLWETNNAVFSLSAGQTNSFSSISIPALLSSNSVVMVRYAMSKKSQTAVTSLTWELREDGGQGEIIWGILNVANTVTYQSPVPQTAFILTSWQEAYGSGKAYQNNVTQTNYYSTRGWETNRTLHLSTIGGGSSSNTFYVPIVQLFEVY